MPEDCFKKGVHLFDTVSPPPVHWSLCRTRTRTPTVGVVAPHYNCSRVSYGLGLPGYRFVTLKRVPFHRLGIAQEFFRNTPLFINPTVDLIHTFNMLPANGPGFVVSFELEMPRYASRPGWLENIGYRILSSKRCRAILALSEIAAGQLREKLLAGGLRSAAGKVGVFRGAVPSSEVEGRDLFTECFHNSPLNLLFVGDAGFGKGLIPTLEASAAARKQGVDLHLTVVSSLRSRPYITGNPEPPAGFRLQLESCPWVTHHLRLHNRQIRHLMREHDVLIFPTMDESLGWVVVEAALEGRPTIATDTFAIPELIDDNQTGKLLPLRLGSSQRWYGLTLPPSRRRQAWLEENTLLCENLLKVLLHVAENRQLLSAWGRGAYRKLSGLYSAAGASKQLSRVYLSALGDTAVR